MDFFEYRVTLHPAEEFNDIILFCSSDGSCNVEEVASGQIKKMETLLNERGLEGWELVQASFGKNGLLVFWKRQIQAS